MTTVSGYVSYCGKMYCCRYSHDVMDKFHICVSALIRTLDAAIDAKRKGNVLSSNVAHDRIGSMYTWNNVATRTEKVCQY